jgi:hypothetical protein
MIYVIRCLIKAWMMLDATKYAQKGWNFNPSVHILYDRRDMDKSL